MKKRQKSEQQIINGFGRTFPNQPSLDLFANIFWEGQALADCIWKFNEQIENLRKIELDKLDRYFPEEGHLRNLRWITESRKLDYSFPLFLNYSFVTTTFAITESFLVKTCELLRLTKGSPIKVGQLAGSKLDRCFEYLRNFGSLNTDAMEMYQPIKVLSTLRNCIVHAAGFIAESKDERELRQIIKARKYLSKAHRLRHDELNKKEREPIEPYVSITEDAGSERLFITYSYAHSVVGYFLRGLFEVFEQTGLASKNAADLSTP